MNNHSLQVSTKMKDLMCAQIRNWHKSVLQIKNAEFPESHKVSL